MNILEKDKETAEIAALKNRINELETLVLFYEEQFRLTKHRQFGSSSEKSEYDRDQLNLFNEVEVAADVCAPEPELVAIEKHYRKVRRSSVDRLPSDLPVEVVEHELPAKDQVFPDCGGAMHVMGRESRRELKIIPAQAKVVEHNKQIILYEYQPDRKAVHPEIFLSGFKGYIHADGYYGYHNLPEDFIVVGCRAHARRKFDEALKGGTKEQQKGSAAESGMWYCNLLFRLERKYAEYTAKNPPQSRHAIHDLLLSSSPCLTVFYQQFS